MTWPEIEDAKTRFELKLTGERIAQRLQAENGITSELFDLVQLNHLEISGVDLKYLDQDKLCRLVNLQSLNLVNNKLCEFPTNIESLCKLKHLDISNNTILNLTDIVLPLSLETLTATHNDIEELCLTYSLPNLTIVDVSFCKLSSFVISNAPLLRQIDVRENKLTCLPECLRILPCLKTLDISYNCLTELSSLILLKRLRELLAIENPIKDSHLRKLLNQKAKTRIIVEFVSTHAPKVISATSSKSDATEHPNLESNGKSLTCTVIPGKFTVLISPEAKLSGYHLVCCVLKGVDLSESKLDKLIREQIRLHDEVFNKRTEATLATHDLEAMSVENLIFRTSAVENVSITPLGRKSIISGKLLYNELKAEAEKKRKLKKKDRLLALHRYLDIVIVNGNVAYLNDANRTLSLHPLTNCEETKLRLTTKDVFLEVCSVVSLEKARKAMDSSVDAFIRLGCWPSSSQDSCIEQIRVLNEDDKSLKYTYPSRIDLKKLSLSVNFQ